jgi:hypothetical protein
MDWRMLKISLGSRLRGLSKTLGPEQDFEKQGLRQRRLNSKDFRQRRPKRQGDGGHINVLLQRPDNMLLRSLSRRLATEVTLYSLCLKESVHAINL